MCAIYTTEGDHKVCQQLPQRFSYCALLWYEKERGSRGLSNIHGLFSCSMEKQAQIATTMQDGGVLNAHCMHSRVFMMALKGRRGQVVALAPPPARVLLADGGIDSFCVSLNVTAKTIP